MRITQFARPCAALLMTLAPASAAPTSPTTGPSIPAPSTPPPLPAATAPATPALPPAVARRVRELARGLSAEHWKDRDAAEKELIALGPDVEPLLREIAAGTNDPEAAGRLKAVLKELEGRRWTAPTLVTLRLKDAPPRRVFDEIFRQAGAELSSHPHDLLEPGAGRGGDLPRAVSVEFDRTPFWAALRDVCNKTGVNARYVYDRHRITLTRDGAMPPMAGPAVVEGPVMVVPEGVNLSARLQFVNPAGTRQRGGSLSMQVYAEPRLRVTRGHFEVEKFEDDKGEDLSHRGDGEGDRGRRGASVPGTLERQAAFSWKVDVPMRMAGGGGTKVQFLRGKLHLFAHLQTQRAEVADVLNVKEQTREVGGKRFTVHAVTATPDGQYNVQMTLFRENVSDEDWAWFHYPYGALRLLDARGRDLATSSGGGGGGREKADFAMQFRRETVAAPADAQPGEPFKLVWDLPVKTRELVIPVAFEDLPLP